MNFIQLEYPAFLALVFALYWVLPTRTLQNALLLIASCVFYGWIHPWFLGLLAFSALLDYNVGRLMHARPQHRDYWLMLSLAGNLGMLGYFKYFDFFVVNLVQALQAAGVSANLTTLSLVLPVGISFYTFQTMSYTIDVYRGELEPRRNLLDYLVYVSFFPQLVAGPIERAGHLMPQVESARSLDANKLRTGFGLIIWGAFKKICLADTIAPYVDKVFILQEPPAPLVWAACLGFLLQILADFSGYTDIARGTARLLGFELSENFRRPYFAASTPEFWQRWHITLSFWIRDYIMVPLLGIGSQLSMVRFVAATVATFTIIGFWHGASWNYVLFGVFHGFWMTVYSLLNRASPTWMRLVGGRPGAILLHWALVILPGALLFRETSVVRIWAQLTRPPLDASPDEWLAVAVLVGLSVILGAAMVLGTELRERVSPRLAQNAWFLPLQTTSWAVLAVLMFIFYRSTLYDFIYFQF